MSDFTHLDKNYQAKMVDVSDKTKQLRIAKAKGKINLQKETVEKILSNSIIKGNVLAVAKVAAIQGSKKTSELIPMCHNVFISQVAVDFEVVDDGVLCFSKVVAVDVTGIEMEALTAVSVALLTIYDMCKAVDKKMSFSDIVLLEKTKQDL